MVFKIIDSSNKKYIGKFIELNNPINTYTQSGYIHTKCYVDVSFCNMNISGSVVDSVDQIRGDFYKTNVKHGNSRIWFILKESDYKNVRFKHIPSDQVYKLNGAGGIIREDGSTNQPLPKWLTENSNDFIKIIDEFGSELKIK